MPTSLGGVYTSGVPSSQGTAWSPGYVGLQPGQSYSSFTGNLYGGGPTNTAASQYANQLSTAPQTMSNIASGLQTAGKQTVASNSPQYGAAVNTLEGALPSGGYTPQQISDIRARAISPIRSIYANAVQDINRQKALQGGYSPNATAAIAQLGRNVPQQISDAVTNVNAGLAQNIVGNQLSAAGNLGQLTSGTTSGDLNRALQALTGQTSLLGTSPGMLGTLGSQVLQAQGQTNQQQEFIDQLNQQGQLAMLAQLIGGA